MRRRHSLVTLATTWAYIGATRCSKGWSSCMHANATKRLKMPSSVRVRCPAVFEDQVARAAAAQMLSSSGYIRQAVIAALRRDGFAPHAAAAVKAAERDGAEAA